MPLKMTNPKVWSILFFFYILFISCQHETNIIGNENSRFRILKKNGKWTLYDNNKPYYIKGAHGIGNLEILNEIGGNSVIAYHNEVTDSLLDLAHRLNISVSIVLDIKKVRFGYDYTDNKVIIPQRNWIRDFVIKYKDHPALLFWIIGNEVHIMKRDNIALWKEVNEISKIIHEIDPEHLTTTTIASYPTKTYDPTQIRIFAPDIDFISLNIYEFAHRVKRERQNIIWGLDAPYLVTEWGGTPYWVMDQTEWGAIIEPSSSSYEKTQQIIQNYMINFERDRDHCIGGYVFYFGEKQERTHTTFSFFLHGKYKTQALESVEYCWNDTITGNYCPRITNAYLDNEILEHARYLPTDSQLHYIVTAIDPEAEPLSMAWEIKREGDYFRKFGGESEPIPEFITGETTPFPYSSHIPFRTPDEEGAFRLFVYVYDTSGNAASVNMPFYTLR